MGGAGAKGKSGQGKKQIARRLFASRILSMTFALALPVGKRRGLGKAVIGGLKGRPTWCLDLIFQHSLLRFGYEFGDGRLGDLGSGSMELSWGTSVLLPPLPGSAQTSAPWP